MRYLCLIFFIISQHGSVFALTRFNESPANQINQQVTGSQYGTKVALNNRGEYVIAWISLDSSNHSVSVYARTYDSSNAPLSDEFHITTASAPSSSYSNWTALASIDYSMDMDDSGTIAFALQVNENSSASLGYFDKYGNNISWQHVTSQGRVVDKPDLAVSSSGEALISWHYSYADGYFYVGARRYDQYGNPLGDEFLVSTGLAYSGSPAVSMLRNGKNAVIAWGGRPFWQLDGNNTGANFNNIHFRLFDFQSQSESTPVLVNTDTQGVQIKPDVAMSNDGSFIIVWESRVGEKQYLDNYGGSYTWVYDSNLFARAFSRDGQALGDQFQINDGKSSGVSVAANENGEFIFIWACESAELKEICGKKFDISNTSLSELFVVHADTSGSHSSASVSSDRKGNFIIAWQGDYSDGNNDIYAKKYEIASSDGVSELDINVSDAEDIQDVEEIINGNTSKGGSGVFSPYLVTLLIFYRLGFARRNKVR